MELESWDLQRMKNSWCDCYVALLDTSISLFILRNQEKQEVQISISALRRYRRIYEVNLNHAKYNRLFIIWFSTLWKPLAPYNIVFILAISHFMCIRCIYTSLVKNQDLLSFLWSKGLILGKSTFKFFYFQSPQGQISNPYCVFNLIPVV